MLHALDSTVIAVDGGGTHCRLAAASDAGVTVVEVGSSNVSTDFDAALFEISEGLRDLSGKIGLSTDELAGLPAFLGLAGVTGPDIGNRVKDALPFLNATVADDRPAALRGALGDQDGVVAHCGTGSFVAARIEGETRLAGGWGPVLGDEGSAQWVGRKALALTLETLDGRHEESELGDAFLDRFGGPAKIVAFAGTAQPSEFGALAPLVTSAAQNDDGMAMLVLQLAALDVAQAARDIGWVPGMPICLTGGIGPHFAKYLPIEIQNGIASPMAEPLAGAIALAQELRREVAHDG